VPKKNLLEINRNSKSILRCWSAIPAQSKTFFSDEKCKREKKEIERARVARFFFVQTFQNGEIVTNDHKLYVPNGHKL
jgi:hypothetical protein